MKKHVLPLLVLIGAALSQTALAGAFNFAYVFDATAQGTPGHVLQGTVDGVLQNDGDTIVVNNVLSASLGGFDYLITEDIGIRAADPFDSPTISLSGSALDFWVCVQGFTTSFNNGGDCPFGDEGGFLISYDVEFGNGPTGGTAHAGIPDLVLFNNNGSPGFNRYRDSDLEINEDNWSASAVPEPSALGLMLLSILALSVSRLVSSS